MSFSVVTTSTYGRRIESLDHPDLLNAERTSALLGRTTRPGVFIEDDVPLMAQLPKFLHPSRWKAMRYSDIVQRGKMQAWNRLKSEIQAGTAGPSFGRDLAEGDLGSHGLTDEDAAWITGGKLPITCNAALLMLQRTR